MIEFTPTAVSTVGEVLASSSDTLLTSNASANTKGAYAEITASSPIAAHAIVVIIRAGVLSSGEDYLIDLATGAAAAEVVLVNNLLITSATAAMVFSVLLPVSIPSGTRISARCQANVGSETCSISIVLIASTGTNITAVETAGANTADSGGTTVDPGTTINTKGSYAELIASTAVAYEWLAISVGNITNVIRGAMDTLLDIATGAAASETVIIDNLYMRVPAVGARQPLPHWFVIPVNIPAGSRIAARSQCSINTATTRLVDVVVYGIAGGAASAGVGQGRSRGVF